MKLGTLGLPLPVIGAKKRGVSPLHPNQTGLWVGLISGISKEGSEYLWVRYRQVAQPETNRATGFAALGDTCVGAANRVASSHIHLRLAPWKESCSKSNLINFGLNIG